MSFDPAHISSTALSIYVSQTKSIVAGYLPAMANTLLAIRQVRPALLRRIFGLRLCVG